MVGIFHSASTGTTTKIFVTDFDATHVIDAATITTALLASGAVTATTLAASAVTGSKIDSATVALANLTTSAYPMIILSGVTDGVSVASSLTRYNPIFSPNLYAVESSAQLTLPFAWAVTGLTFQVRSNTVNATTDITLRATSTDVSGTSIAIATSGAGEQSLFGLSTNIASSSKICLQVITRGSGVIVFNASAIYGIRT